MPHRPPLVRASLAICALLIGCSSDGIQVSTTFDPLSAFPAQATFVWDDAANKLPADPRIARLELGPIIKQAAEAEFAARGYRAATGGSPDYRLSYQLVVNSWIGADNSRSIGSLSLLLVEANSGRRVWLGFGRAEVHVGLSYKERKQRIQGTLTRMLQKFPPSQRGS